MANELKTICPACSVGCGMLASPDSHRPLKLRGDSLHPANFGRLCPAGLDLPRQLDPAGRLLYAMVRDGARPETSPEAAFDHPAMAVSASRAIADAATRLERVVQRYGPGAIAFVLSGGLSNESLYLANKFAKAFLRTNHIDSRIRFGTLPGFSGMRQSLGSDGSTACFADIELADTFLLINSNPAETHPVLFDRIQRQVRRRGAKLVVIDPHFTPSAEHANVHLAIRPGTEVTLLNGLLRAMNEAEALDPVFIRQSTEGWNELRDHLEQFTPEYVAATCGISPEQFMAAVRTMTHADALLSVMTAAGAHSVMNAFASSGLANLHLATGMIGRPGCGILMLSDQANSLGAIDTGATCDGLPGQRSIFNPLHRQQMERYWGLAPHTLLPRPGYDTAQIIEAVEREEIRAVWIIGDDAIAMLHFLPDVAQALQRAEVVIVQGAHMAAEMSDLADVMFPAAVALEQAGTYTSSQRGVSLAAVAAAPPGDARPDWWWIQQVAIAMGWRTGMNYGSAEAIFDEFARSTAGQPDDQAALTYDVLRIRGPQQWPFPSMGRPLTRRFENGVFARDNGKGLLTPLPQIRFDEHPDGSYPLLLITRANALPGEQTQADRLLATTTRLHVHPHDIRRFGLSHGAIVRLESRHGRAEATVYADETVAPGTVSLPGAIGKLWDEGPAEPESGWRCYAVSATANQPEHSAIAVGSPFEFNFGS